MLERTGHIGIVTRPDAFAGRLLEKVCGWRHEFLREIPGPAGPLEALLDLPDGEPRAVAVFGHPHPLHGGTMHTKALYQAAKAMPRIGVAALRFNFRGVGRSAGTFDAGPGEKDDFRPPSTSSAERFPGPADLGRGHVVRLVDCA